MRPENVPLATNATEHRPVLMQIRHASMIIRNLLDMSNIFGMVAWRSGGIGIWNASGGSIQGRHVDSSRPQAQREILLHYLLEPRMTDIRLDVDRPDIRFTSLTGSEIDRRPVLGIPLMILRIILFGIEGSLFDQTRQ